MEDDDEDAIVAAEQMIANVNRNVMNALIVVLVNAMLFVGFARWYTCWVCLLCFRCFSYSCHFLLTSRSSSMSWVSNRA